VTHRSSRHTPMIPLSMRAAVLAAAVLSLAALPPHSAPHADRGCKPLAPISVQISAREPSGGPVVTLDFAVRPVLGLQAVAWHLQLADGLTLLEGEVDGEAAPERDALTEGTASVVLPADGRFVRATLVVTGAFMGHDEHGESGLETVQVESSLSWGELPEPGTIVISTDAETRAPAAHVAVPAAHRAGR